MPRLGELRLPWEGVRLWTDQLLLETLSVQPHRGATCVSQSNPQIQNRLVRIERPCSHRLGRRESNLDMAISRMLCLPERICTTQFHLNPQAARNTQLSRTVANSRSAEIWRELSHSEKTGWVLPNGSRDLNQKLLLIVGSVANILAQRTGGRGEAGGGRGTGIEPSPRNPQ